MVADLLYHLKLSGTDKVAVYVMYMERDRFDMIKTWGMRLKNENGDLGKGGKATDFTGDQLPIGCRYKTCIATQQVQCEPVLVTFDANMANLCKTSFTSGVLLKRYSGLDRRSLAPPPVSLERFKISEIQPTGKLTHR